MPLVSPLAIAPMIDWTYSHFRVFMRLLAPHCLLYTDMQTTGAILANPERTMFYNPCEHPLALQIGGSDKKDLIASAMKAEHHGFIEVNLNLGCPSDRVQAGRFGACLMREAEHVADCIQAMKRAVKIPVSAKIRIGIDHDDSYSFFSSFATRLIQAGCDKLIVHARKAWLTGLSPKQNRTIPPVQYDYVYQLKQDHADYPIVINGNIDTLTSVQHHLTKVDGVMLGRLACQDPYAIALIHAALYPTTALPSRASVIETYLDYIESLDATRCRSRSLVLKPLFNMAHGLSQARLWKKELLDVQETGEWGCVRQFLKSDIFR